jgi:hypothetical protein
MADFASPKRWTQAELEAARLAAIADFVEERSKEGIEPYRSACAESLGLIERLLAATDDLRELATGVALAAEPDLLRIARFLTSPPTSAADLNTLAGAKVAGRTHLDIDSAMRAAGVLRSVLDPERFPWTERGSFRPPTPEERRTAMRWTAGLSAVQTIHTARRSGQSGRQQNAVAQLLIELGFERVRPRQISVVGEIGRGQFMPESVVVGSKCDVPIGLRDGRLLLIECKVSNSEINSVKRLNRETENKKDTWSHAFGERAITAAVLSGVFRVQNLRDAQANGIAIFWERDLTPLRQFLTASAG